MSFWATTAFAFTPMMIGSIASIGVMYTIPPAAMQLGQLNVLSPAVFLDPNVEAGAIYALAQALSLTTIWTLCLLIIGYGVVGTKRSSTTLRSVVVVTPWLLTVALRVLPALLF
jgi:predicted membrane protein